MVSRDGSDALRERVFEQIAAFADVARDTLADDTTLDSLGLDSSDAVVLAMSVQELVAPRELDPAIFLRCATIGEAADEVAQVGKAAQ